MGVCARPTALARLVALGAHSPLVSLSLAPVFGHDRALVMVADVAAVPIRGRFLGRRGTVAGGGPGGRRDCRRGIRLERSANLSKLPAWIPYGVMGGLGAGLMIVSLLPLVLMPSAEVANGPLSLWERVRVRAFGRRMAIPACPAAAMPSPPAPLLKGEGSRAGGRTNLFAPFADTRSCGSCCWLLVFILVGVLRSYPSRLRSSFPKQRDSIAVS